MHKLGHCQWKMHLPLRMNELDLTVTRWEPPSDSYWLGCQSAQHVPWRVKEGLCLFLWSSPGMQQRNGFHLISFGWHWTFQEFGTQYTSILPLSSSISSTGNRCHDYKLLVVGKCVTWIITTCCQKKRLFPSFGEKHGV